YSSCWNSIIENNEISGFSYGMSLEYLSYGMEIKNNNIHNNSNYGIYLNQVGYYNTAPSNPIEFVNNRFVDNNYGIYKGDSSSTYSYSYQIKDNLFKSNSLDGIWTNNWARQWVVENNTFDGDDDQRYGFWLRYSYKGIFGNNTFSDHTSSDMYFYQCSCTGTNAVKFFSNSYSTISVYSTVLINVYNNLNIRTLDEDDNAFSNVDLEIKDSVSTYYKTSHWGGSDARTDSSGYISSSKYIRSGYYSSSTTLTENTITVKIAHGVRAKTTSFTFDSDGTKNIEVPNNYKDGVIENKDTETLYSSFSSAVSAASAGDVLQLWAWNYNSLEVTKGVVLRGNSTTTAIVDGGSSSNAIEIKSNSVTIENLTLQGSSDSILFAGSYSNLLLQNLTISDADSDNGVHFDGTSSSTISNVTVNSTKRKAVLLEDVTSITVKNSLFKNSSTSHGFEISDGSSNVVLDNVFIHNAGYSGSSAYGLYISGSSGVTVKNNTKVGNSKTYELYANGASTLKVQNSTFIGPNLALIEDSDGFLVEKSTFKDSSSGDYGVYIKNTDNGIFKDNSILNSGSDDGTDFGALYLTGSKTNLLQNNTITNSGRSGIHLKSSSNDNKIYSNTVSSSYFSGLYIQSSDRSLIRNNSFSSSGDNGIKLSSTDYSIIDNNTLSSNTDYGLYVSNSDDAIIKYNTVSDNNAGMYFSASDDVVVSNNDVDDHSSHGVYLADSKRARVKSNEIKNSLGDALYLSSNCDSAFIDNNTIKSNGDSVNGRAVRIIEVEDTILYNNTIDSNDYSGIVLTESSNNKIVQNVIKGNGKYGIQILNDATKSANNTIKDNTINDNSNVAILNNGIFTNIFNNTIKYNEDDGIKITSEGARSTISSNNIVDNEGNSISVSANNVDIKSNVIDGDSSTVAIVILSSDSVSVENNTVEGGLQGIKVQSSENAFIYNNSVKSNSGYGIYLLIDSFSGEVKYNNLTDNEDNAIVISSSNNTEIYNNTIKENTGYGIVASNSKFIVVKGNTIEDNDGGIKYSSCNYCNLTFNKAYDNGDYGLWLSSGSNNNTIRHNNFTESSTKDIYLQGSTDNIAFNITFSTIGVDSTSNFTITANLAIVFEDDDNDGFPGIDFALTSDGVTKYSTLFYGGSDSVSDSNGAAGATFSLVYRLYDGSSTPTNIPNILKYHYGVRSKEKSIDMSTSHTETVSVPSYWAKGLVRNTDTSNDYYKIQDAIDNASSGHTLHIWAWTYSENVIVNQTVTIIGNATSNTTLNITSGKGFSITSDEVSISKIMVKGCGTSSGSNAFQVTGDDVTVENVIGKTCHKGISVEGSGAWIGNSSFINNDNIGVHVWEGDSSTTTVTFYKNNISSNGHHGILVAEDDVVIGSNIILDNSGDGISVSSSDVIVSGNTISGNSDGIELINISPRAIISNNIISDSSQNGIKVSNSNSNDGVFENNTISDSNVYAIYVNHADRFYFGNNSLSSSGNKDIRFNKVTVGNTGKGNNFSTIDVGTSAYFAIYNDLTLKFMKNQTIGFEDLDVKIISDGSTRYSTSGYGGSDSKTNSNGQLSRNFEFKYNEYDGSSTPNLVYTNISYQYGVRAKDVSINMTTSHTETITVPSFWTKGLVHNLNTGDKYSTIQDAIDGASSGDVLQLWAYEYVEHDIEITERVTLVGNSTSSVIINGTWSDSIFDITTNSIVIKNMTIENSANGTAKECIGVSSGSGIVIENLILKNCYKGIVVDSSNVDITNVTIQNSVNDGIVTSASNIDISSVTVKNSGDDGIVINSSSTTLENSTIQNNGDDGIVLNANAFIYNNTIKSNSGKGINVGEGSDYAKIISNVIDDNVGQGVLVAESHHVKLTNNTIEDSNDYGVHLYLANFTQIHKNKIDDNDGGIRFVSTRYSNVTKTSLEDNNGRGIWFTSSSDSNNIRDSSVSGSTLDDLELDSSEKNTGFNFTFGDGSIDVDSDSDFRLMNSLNIRFIDENGAAFSGLDIELFNHDTILYATNFFGGSKAVSNDTGYIAEELIVAYEIYNGSSTTEDVDTTLKYHYGVRGKTKEIDMSSSHTETITVQSYWTKGLV
ncbi:MAG: right-handed parallel beta-helix repeat-containing protein, partial [Candidatus Poseidoniales archaeon]